MARKSITFTALAATLAMALAPVAASAHDRDNNYNGYDQRGYNDHDRRDRQHDRRDDRRDDRRGYYTQRGYAYGSNYAPQRGYYADNGYQRGYNNYPQQGGYYADTSYQRGYNGRCRGNGTAGTIIGAIAGGLIGNSVAGRGDRTLGTVLGGGVGAVAGRAIDRSDDRC